jgi:hypothetical protein
MEDNRHLNRDSLFLMAEFRIDGEEEEHRIKVRNLSAAGMMGEGPVRVSRGFLVSVCLRNVGWVDGTIAWVSGERFGVAFAEEIDPMLARAPLTKNAYHEDYTRPFRLLGQMAGQGGTLRKI